MTDDKLGPDSNNETRHAMDTETRPPPYQYRPVRPGWIRILHLLSQPGEPLRCKIETVELGRRESSDFIALSYVWGESTDVDTIGVVGDDGSLVGQLTLTTSLHHSLQDLAGCDEIQPKTFWINQICINQHDDDEKSHQVLHHMSNVYQSARRVVTHIGVREERDDEAIALLRRIYGFYEPFAHIVDSWWVGATSRQVYYHYSRTRIPTELRFPEDLSQGDGLELFTHAEGILGGPWATRYWMVQENVLNPDTVCLRGRRTISLNLVNRIGGLNWLGLLSPVASSTNHLQPLFATRAQWRQEEATIQSLHLSHRRRVCADPRDKIYAILGLANDATRLGILPDYHKPVAQVFTDLWVAYTRLWLVDDIPKLLSFLEESSCGTGSGSGMDSYDSAPIPTWVPTCDGDGYGIPNESDADATQTDSNMRARNLAAQVDFQSTSDVTNGNLLVKGLELAPDGSSALDVCLGTFPFVSPVEPYDSSRGRLDAVALLERTMEFFGDTDGALAMVYETLLGGAKLPTSERTGARPTDADLAQALRDVRGILRRQIDLQITHLPAGRLTREAFHLYANRFALHSRSLWVSENQRLCVAPNQAQKGDLPVILFGGRWVYYLRSRGGLHRAGLGGDDVHEYVGWGSIAGCMHGELLEEAGWEDRVKTFTLI